MQQDHRIDSESDSSPEIDNSSSPINQLRLFDDVEGSDSLPYFSKPEYKMK